MFSSKPYGLLRLVDEVKILGYTNAPLEAIGPTQGGIEESSFLIEAHIPYKPVKEPIERMRLGPILEQFR